MFWAWHKLVVPSMSFQHITKDRDEGQKCVKKCREEEINTKRSNKQKPPITELTNLLDDTPASIISNIQSTQPQISAPTIDASYPNPNQTRTLVIAQTSAPNPCLKPSRNVNFNSNFNLNLHHEGKLIPKSSLYPNISLEQT